MEGMPLETHASQLGVADLRLQVVLPGVERGAYDETGAGGRARDQADDGLMTDERPTTPVVGDEAEEAMLDLVPLAGAGREVADRELEFQRVGEVLERDAPQARARAVAAAAVRRNQKLGGTWKAAAPHAGPPAANAVHGELGGIVIDPHADPTLVVDQIVDAVRNSLAELGILEVVDPDFFGLSLGAPRSASILEIPDELLLLRVHRDRRLPLALEAPH